MATTSTVLAAILAVFTAIGEWIVATIPNLVALFWAEGALTFLGTLAVCALGISVVFLLVGIIQRFLHFAG